MQLTIDARMLYHSGIGTTLRNILLRLPELSPADTIYIADEKSRGFLASICKNAGVHLNASPIYSVAEQIYAVRHTSRNAVVWSPHYNIPLLHRGKLVTTIHDLGHLALPQFFGDWHKQLYARFMFAAVARNSDAIICVSKWTADELLQRTSADHRKVRIIHNGIDKSWFNVPPGERPHPRAYLLYVGNVKLHKNLQRLIQAFVKLKTARDLDLMIVGKKEGFITGDSTIFDIANRLSHRVHFTGYVSDEVLKQYYVSAKALVFPSLYEGFGFPPLEAMASGCPVIASSAASLPEICGDAAIYCDPFSVDDIADQIKLVLGLKDHERAGLIEKGKVHARRFDWDQCARATWEVIRDVGS